MALPTAQFPGDPEAAVTQAHTRSNEPDYRHRHASPVRVIEPADGMPELTRGARRLRRHTAEAPDRPASAGGGQLARARRPSARTASEVAMTSSA